MVARRGSFATFPPSQSGAIHGKRVCKFRLRDALAYEWWTSISPGCGSRATKDMSREGFGAMRRARRLHALPSTTEFAYGVATQP
jgi:hypothetical protein